MIAMFAVALRSPRFSTPSRYFTAMTVVPCVSSAFDAGVPAVSGRGGPPGRVSAPSLHGTPTSSAKLAAGAAQPEGRSLFTASLPVAPRLVGVHPPHPAQQVAGVGAPHVRRLRPVVAARPRPGLLRHRPLDPLLRFDRSHDPYSLSTTAIRSSSEAAPAARRFASATAPSTHPVRLSQAGSPSPCTWIRLQPIRRMAGLNRSPQVPRRKARAS